MLRSVRKRVKKEFMKRTKEAEIPFMKCYM